MKKILLSVSVIAVVAAVVLGVTTAFFSDTETSTGNTFTAGSLDLKIDSQAKYNGQTVPASTWALKDLVPTSDKFFNFSDIKPGDDGENTISVHVDNNDAWGCFYIYPKLDADVTCTEPELNEEVNCAPTADGELDENIKFRIWTDDGDNVYEGGSETYITRCNTSEWCHFSDINPAGEVWPLGVLTGGATSFYGIEWNLPTTTTNIVQTDTWTADVVFSVVQRRNNDTYKCPKPSQTPTMNIQNLENKDGQWNIIAGDGIAGTITYSTGANTLYGTVVASGLEKNAKYQITLNGSGSCLATDTQLATSGSNLFQSGYWNNWAPNLSSTCIGSPGEGVYNMNLISDWYTVISDASGNINYSFNLALKQGTYTGVKVIVKKMLDTYGSPWVDSLVEHTTNLFEVAPITFTVF